MDTSVSEHVVEMVKRWRGFRLWSREELATQCTYVGFPHLTFAVLTNIETGRLREDGTRRRTVSIDEVYALAWALKVKPSDLLPGDDFKTPAMERSRKVWEEGL